MEGVKGGVEGVWVCGLRGAHGRVCRVCVGCGGDGVEDEGETGEEWRVRAGGDLGVR